ncbi:MAG: biopolymer transporter ExbD, partial [Cyclobacteriaceae bacterium]
NGEDPASSDSPEKAIVSFKTDRGTTHKRFVEILDIMQAAYYDIYADQAGVTNEEFRKIASDLNDPENKRLYDKGREGIPMAISIAEPTKVGN